MTTTAIRLGFVGISAGGAGYGGGSWATNSHLPYLQSDRNNGAYKIIALQNSSQTAAEKAAEKFDLGDVACYGNPKDIANDPNVDLIAVSVNIAAHYDATIPALKTGKDVFVEWPLARTLADAEEMSALARDKGLRTMVGLQARQNPSIVAAKKLVDDFKVGEIIGTTMHGYGMISGATSPKDSAYGFPIEAGANLLTIPFGHAVDALCYVLGELNYVSATLANRRPKFSVTDGEGRIVGEGNKTAHDFVVVTGTLQRDGGVVNVVYEGGMNPSGGPGFFWQINGTKGTIVLEGAMGHLQMFQPKIKFGGVGEEMKDVEVNWVGNDFSYAVGEAWNALSGKGKGHVTTFEDALVRHRMIHAIYRSNENGTREKYT